MTKKKIDRQVRKSQKEFEKRLVLKRKKISIPIGDLNEILYIAARRLRTFQRLGNK